MYYSEIRELDLKLSGKSGNYQEISVNELAGNPGLIQAQQNTDQRRILHRHSQNDSA